MASTVLRIYARLFLQFQQVSIFALQKRRPKCASALYQQRSLFDRAIYLLLSIWKPNKELKTMDRIIDANPQIVKAVQADLNRGSKAHGRPGMSAERILRSAILKQRKGYSYRALRDHINESVAYRWFTRSFLIAFRISRNFRKLSGQLAKIPGRGSMIYWYNMPKIISWKMGSI